MSPLVSKRAIVAVALVTFAAMALALGLHLTVRAVDRPSDSAMRGITQTVQAFFHAYDVEWPSACYKDESLPDSATETLRRDKRQELAQTVADSALVERVIDSRLSRLQQARYARGAIITHSGHQVVDVSYLRTTVDRTVVVRVEVEESRQEAMWETAVSDLTHAQLVQETRTYDLSVHPTADGWRVVGMRRAD